MGNDSINWEERYHRAVEGGAESIRKANERADSFWEERRELARLLTLAEQRNTVLYDALDAINKAGTLNDQDVIDKMIAALAKAKE